MQNEVAISLLWANPSKWSNTLKQFVGKLALKGLIINTEYFFLTHFWLILQFYTPWKQEKKLLLFWCFQGV